MQLTADGTQFVFVWQQRSWCSYCHIGAVSNTNEAIIIALILQKQQHSNNCCTGTKQVNQWQLAPHLRTRGFCCIKVLLPAYHSWQQLAQNTQEFSSLEWCYLCRVYNTVITQKKKLFIVIVLPLSIKLQPYEGIKIQTKYYYHYY